MRRHHAIVFVLSTFFVPAAQASDVSWMFRPGYYTHSPITGQRVAQYEPERPSIIPTDPTYQESGYRHTYVQLGQDHLNIVQTWGAGTAIRPYGEWDRPYRPGATPYGPWYYPSGPRTAPYPYWQDQSGQFPSGQNHNGPNRPPYNYNPSPYATSPYGPGPVGGGAWPYGAQAFPGQGPMPYSAMPAQPMNGPVVGQGQEL
jgi:hypothetical protein